MLVLAIDASTYAGSAAVLQGMTVLADRVVAMRGEREERLMPAVAEVLGESGVGPGDLDAVACGGGPGSFTSLRIAASIAKGIAASRVIPLLVAPSPVLIVAGAWPSLPAGAYVAMLDAMRGDVFALEMRLGRDGRISGVGEVRCLPRDEAARRASSSGATLMGPAQSPGIAPHARGFAAIIASGLARTVDAASWEPEYGRKAEAQVRWEVAHGRPLEGA